MGRVTGMRSLLIVLLAAPAEAAGVSLAWNACFGDGGFTARAFACDSNAGNHSLVGSFELGADAAGVTGIEVVLDLYAENSTLPPWWDFFNAATCRRTSLRVSASLPSDAANCSDWASGSAIGGLVSYASTHNGLPRSTARMKLAYAVMVPVDLPAGSEQFAFSATIDHVSTVGDGACGGCCDGVGLQLNSVNVVMGSSANVRLTGAADYVASDLALWQSGASPWWSGTGAGGCVTPVRPRSWGEIRSLYR